MQESIPAFPQQRPTPSRTFLQRLKHAGATAVHHAKNHAGVGVVCAVAYFDPYVLLKIVVLSGRG